ncbi:hypothetical protein JCM3770_006192 [Rhodotorula araucariae]
MAAPRAPEPGSAPATPRAVRAMQSDTAETTPRHPLHHTPPMLLSREPDDDARSSSSELTPSSDDDDDAWAGQLLPSGYSPPQSPLLADIVSRARHPSSLSALAGRRRAPDPESRPMSDFDWAGAYADSPSPSLMHAFAPPDAHGPQGRASPPLPPLPARVDAKGEAAALRAQEEGSATDGLRINAPPVEGDVDSVPAVPPMRCEPGAAQLQVPTTETSPARSISPLPAPPIHPSLAVRTALPASDPTASSSSSSQSSPAALDAAQDHTLLAPEPSAMPNDRPTSRTSFRSASSGRRSPAPQPPRPPRRQTSSLSLQSRVSDAASAPAVEPASTHLPPQAPAAAPPPAAARESPTPPIFAPPVDRPAATAAGAGAGAVAAVRVAPEAPPVAGADAAPLAVPRLRTPLGGPRRSTGIGTGTGGGAGAGTAPSVPEKSARRVSRRLSVLGPLQAAAEGDGATRSAEGSARGSPAITDGEGGKRFSVPYSVSDLALAYGRDSWAEYASSDSEYPPSALAPQAGPGTPVDGDDSCVRSSRIREPAGAEDSPCFPPDGNGGAGEAPHAGLATPPRLPGGGETARSSTPRGDAKARAAAFIADLKRAKAASATGRGETPPPPVVGGGTAHPVHISPSASPLVLSPRSPTASPALPSPPRAPSPPPRVHRSGSVFTTTARPPHPFPPSSPSPPPPPPNADKRPSDASARTLSIRRRSSVPPVPAPAPTSLSIVPRPPLLRRRPLPAAVQVAVELRRARTPRERGRIYAERLNELARERSRLDEWIAAVRDARGTVERSPLVTSSPNASRARAARQDASSETFAPRADAYKAKELPSLAFSPRDLPPSSAPYPGVLHFGSSGGGSTKGGGAHGTKSSFFSGLGVGRSSLGRRVSKRDHAPPPVPPPLSSSNATASASAAAASMASLRSTISGPTHLLPASSSAPSAHASHSWRSIQGPRMPNPVPPPGAAGDVHSPSPSGSPNENLTAAAAGARTSFSYGSVSALAGSASVPAHLGARYGAVAEGAGVGAGAAGELKLARLQDILPQAAREDLVGALARAGGDDVLAISVYLSEQASRH